MVLTTLTAVAPAGITAERRERMSAEEAITKLAGDLACSKREDERRGHGESVVITDQATVREVLTEIERLKDQLENPQAYAHRRSKNR